MTHLHIGSNQSVWLDGLRIDKVLDVAITVDNGRSVVSVEFIPDSVQMGDPSPDLVQEVLEAHLPVNNGVVDMDRAMENARKRARGESVGAKVQPVLPPRPIKDSPQA